MKKKIIRLGAMLAIILTCAGAGKYYASREARQNEWQDKVEAVFQEEGIDLAAEGGG